MLCLLVYADTDSRQPQSTVTELRLPVQLFSGIRPPAEVLQAMAQNSGFNGPSNRLNAPPPLPHRPSVKDGARPPASASTAADTSAPPAYSEAPPSYEDAIADNLPAAVVHGSRPQYAQPTTMEDQLLPTDEKRGLH